MARLETRSTRRPKALSSSSPRSEILPEESPDGVDLTLIRYTLSLTPLERLELLQDWVDGLAELGQRRAEER